MYPSFSIAPWVGIGVALDTLCVEFVIVFEKSPKVTGHGEGDLASSLQSFEITRLRLGFANLSVEVVCFLENMPFFKSTGQNLFELLLLEDDLWSIVPF